MSELSDLKNDFEEVHRLLDEIGAPQQLNGGLSPAARLSVFALTGSLVGEYYRASIANLKAEVQNLRADAAKAKDDKTLPAGHGYPDHCVMHDCHECRSGHECRAIIE